MSRIVKVSTPKSDRPISFSTSASTWGELKEDFSRNNVDYNGLKAIIKESRVTLESDQAQLPESNFTVFLLVDKVKSGLFDKELFLKDLKDKFDTVFEELEEGITDGDYGNTEEEEEECEECDELAEEREDLESEFGG